MREVICPRSLEISGSMKCIRGFSIIGTETCAKLTSILYQLDLSGCERLKPLIYRSIFLYQLG